MVNPLDNGNPLTYNWLNQLANAVISHDKSLSKITGNQRLSVIPHHITSGVNSGTVQILTDQVPTNFAANSADTTVNVKFPTSFSNSQVIVFAQVNYAGPGPSGFSAVCTVTNIGVTGCTINVRRLPPLTKTGTTAATVSYIAIGPGKAS